MGSGLLKWTLNVQLKSSIILTDYLVQFLSNLSIPIIGRIKLGYMFYNLFIGFFFSEY